MTRRHSRSEAALEETLNTLDPDSERYLVLSAARAFKASWVDLGEQLTQTREGKNYEAWGYVSFDAYCRRELRIKKDTANKLTRSFSFLRDHEPTILEPKVTNEVPPLDVVDILSQARERDYINESQLSEIRGDVFNAKKTPTKSQVVKRIREVEPLAFKPKPKPKAANDTADLRRSLILAERLLECLKDDPAASDCSVTCLANTVTELQAREQEQKQEQETASEEMQAA